MDKFPNQPPPPTEPNPEAVPEVATEQKERRRPIPQEIEAKIFAPETNPNYFVSVEFFKLVDSLLKQHGKNLSSSKWNHYTDQRFKPTTTEASDPILLPLANLLKDPAEIDRLEIAFEYLGFSTIQHTENDLVLSRPNKLPKRGVRLRAIENGPLFFNVKQRLPKRDQRPHGQVMQRAETEDVSINDPGPLIAALGAAGYTLESTRQKFHRAWTLPAGEYTLATGAKIKLKTATKIEISWPPGGLIPWIEIEAGREKDVARGATLLGFDSQALQPISTAEHYADEAARLHRSPTELAKQLEAFSPEEKLTIQNQMVELEKFEQPLPSVL